MPSEADLEKLLDQRDWVRQLALGLLGNNTHSEDIAQETLLLAWERLRQPGPGLASMRAWLGTVTRNKVQSHVAGSRRRVHREQSVAQTEALGSASDSVQALEVQRLLTKAVLDLPSPGREIVVLRFYEGLSPREIAQRLGLPPKHVHDRLHRSLGKLRKDIRKDPTSQIQARISLPLGSLLLMKNVAVAVVCCTLLAFLGRAVLGRSTGLEPKGIPGLEAPAQLASLDAAQPEHSADLPVRAAVKKGLAQNLEATTVEESAAPARNSAPPVGHVRVRVQDGRTLEPLAGIGIQFVQVGARSWAAKRILTDNSGSAHLELDTAGELVAHTNRPGMTGEMEAHRFQVQLGQSYEHTFSLGRGGAISGRVVDYAGRPVPDASIWLGDGNGMPFDGQVATQADERGEFLLERLSGFQAVAARAPGLEPSRALAPLLGWEAEEPATCELVLPGVGGDLKGRIVDRQGQPVAGVHVFIGAGRGDRLLLPGRKPEYAPPPVRLTTDQDGAFFAPGLPPGPNPVEARGAATSFATGTALVVAGQSTEWTLVVQPCGSLRGTLREAGGRPASGATVELSGGDSAGGLLQSSAETDEEGHFQIPQVSAGTVQLRAWGADESLAIEAALLIRAGIEASWEGNLTTGSILEGQVVDESGQELEGLTVRYRGHGSEAERTGQVQTDSSGRFRFEVLGSATYQVEVAGPGDLLAKPLVRRKDIRVSDGPVRLSLEANSLPSGRVMGRVVDTDGVGVGHAELILQGNGTRPLFQVLRTDEDGSFDFRYLPIDQGYSLQARGAGTTPAVVVELDSLQAGQATDLGSLELP